MKKPEALAIFEAVMGTIERPVVGNFACQNCQTWVEDVLAAERPIVPCMSRYPGRQPDVYYQLAIRIQKDLII